MEIVDAGTFFGVRPSTDPDLSGETLLACMARNGVSAALTCALKAIQYDARAGNDQALALCRAHPQLHPVAAVDPRAWPGCLAEVERCAGLGFVGFRLAREFPGWARKEGPVLDPREGRDRVDGRVHRELLPQLGSHVRLGP